MYKDDKCQKYLILELLSLQLSLNALQVSTGVQTLTAGHASGEGSGGEGRGERAVSSPSTYTYATK